MTWEEIAALGSIASAVILAIGSVAAVVQLRHARLSNQLEGYLTLYRQSNSLEMNDARMYVRGLPIADDATAAKHVADGIDPRITLLGNYLNELASLVRARVLDRDLFIPLLWQCTLLWPILAPYARAMRRRNSMPTWADVQYVAESSSNEDYLRKLRSLYPRAFRRILDVDTDERTCTGVADVSRPAPSEPSPL